MEAKGQRYRTFTGHKITPKLLGRLVFLDERSHNIFGGFGQHELIESVLIPGRQ